MPASNAGITGLRVIRKNNYDGMSRRLSLKTVRVVQTAQNWCRRDAIARWEAMIRGGPS
jgi:hypothetical protein